jgi:16S rRNA (guanine527-N7)-methyltransferase
VDKAHLERLAQGRKILGLEPAPEVDDALLRYAAELLRWNARVNLTAVTDPDEVVEKHLLDSLAVWPEVRGATTLLDLGAGAGLPGLVLALASPSLSVTLVDAVAKKVGFLKHAAATLGLAGRVKAVHARLEGDAEKEGLPRAEVVISRAFMDAERFVPLARQYVAPGGRVVAMLGKTPDTLTALNPTSVRSFELPFSKAPRAVAVFSER